MSTTVKESLALDTFKDFVVLEGFAGLNRQIITTTFIEAPDSWKWARGGEFVITLAYSFQSEDALLAVVGALIERNVACLGIKTDRYIKKIPQSVLDLADANDFPIIHIPSHVPFADIIHPVQALVLHDQARLLRYSENVRHAFFDLSVNGAEIEEILPTLVEFTHYSLALMGTSTEVRYVVAEPCSKRSGAIENQPLYQVLTAFPHEDISIEGKLLGYLIFDSDGSALLDKWTEIPINQAKGALLLYLQRRNAQNQVETRYRGEFVQDLLSNNIRMEREVWNRARIFNWDLTGPQAVVVVDIDNYKSRLTSSLDDGFEPYKLENTKTRIYSVVKLFVSTLGKKFPYTELSDSIVYIFPAGISRCEDPLGRKLKDILPKMMHKIKEETDFTVTVGIGEPCENVFACYKSYMQAQEGLELMREDTGGNVIARWREMGMYKLLHTLRGNSDADEFMRKYLGVLIDDEHNAVLLSTLLSLVDNNWNIRKTAGALSLHYNTMKYRCGKISEILGIDIAISEDRLNIMVAAKLYRLSLHRR